MDHNWQERLTEEVSQPNRPWDLSLQEFLAQENRGERHPKAKLTERDVQVIRKACEAGFPQKAIAKSFSVSQATVSNIANNKQWKHVQ